MDVARNTTPMTCRELVELVTEHLDGALSPEDAARFEAHLAGCEDCTTYVEQYTLTIEALGALGAGDIAPASLEALRRAFRDRARGREA
jgi:anti-sigma factor RsiW